jgi:isopenicillin-N epimerase
VTYLNHGSFGPSPLKVIAARREWIERLESDPVDFLTRQLDSLVLEARQRLARFVGASGENLVYVDNATAAMNVVAASVSLQPGDEVLAADHDYGAVLRIWERKCKQSGATLVVRSLPNPLTDPEELADAFLAGVTSRTRLLVFSHVTSSTAVILPVKILCERSRALDVPVCIDGPHALAMLDVDLPRLDCDYYTASCHKWLCGPFGTGFLYVHPRAQDTIQPAVLSWGRTPLQAATVNADEPVIWTEEFTWSGTRDPSGYLSVPTAIDFMEAVGLQSFRERTHQLATRARHELAAVTKTAPLTPDSPDWYASMVAIPLAIDLTQGIGLRKALWEQYRLEVPIFEWQGKRILRVSCHLYNRWEDIELLLRALRETLPKL